MSGAFIALKVGGTGKILQRQKTADWLGKGVMINKGLFTSNYDSWETPQTLFDSLNKEFDFTIDVAASKDNAKCKRFYSKEDDAFIHTWEDEVVFCNPPYGRGIDKWVEKLWCGKAKIAVGLLPARTDTKWFHSYIYNQAEIRFLKGRLKFSNAVWNAPFPSMIAIWRK